MVATRRSHPPAQARVTSVHAEAVATLEEKFRDRGAQHRRRREAEGGDDFVDDIAISLPLLAIADLNGVPEADRGSFSTGRTRS